MQKKKKLLYILLLFYSTVLSLCVYSRLLRPQKSHILIEKAMSRSKVLTLGEKSELNSPDQTKHASKS